MSQDELKHFVSSLDFCDLLDGGFLAARLHWPAASRCKTRWKDLYKQLWYFCSLLSGEYSLILLHFIYLWTILEAEFTVWVVLIVVSSRKREYFSREMMQRDWINTWSRRWHHFHTWISDVTSCVSGKSIFHKGEHIWFCCRNDIIIVQGCLWTCWYQFYRTGETCESHERYQWLTLKALLFLRRMEMIAAILNQSQTRKTAHLDGTGSSRDRTILQTVPVCCWKQYQGIYSSLLWIDGHNLVKINLLNLFLFEWSLVWEEVKIKIRF